MYTIAQIEDAIVVELQASAVLTALNTTIDSYHGEIDDLVKMSGQLTIKLPAIYVLFGGAAYSEPANRSYDKELSFTVIAIAKDLRGDDKLKAAMYPILQEIEAVLVDNALDIDIEPMHPLRVEPELITKLFSIYSFDFKTSFSL